MSSSGGSNSSDSDAEFDGNIKQSTSKESNEKAEADSKQPKEADIDETLDEETKQILGDIPGLEEKKCVSINKNIAKRWNYWLHKGLTKEEKDLLTSKFSRKGECYLEAPEMNAEVLSGLSAAGKVRDKHWTESQNTLGSAMAVLGRTATVLLEGEEEISGKEILQQLCDVGKLLAEVHYQQSMSRRAFVIPKLSDKKYKEVLEKAEWDSMLFGKDLLDKLKSAKTMDKIAKEYVIPQRTKPATATKSENDKSLSSKNKYYGGQAYKPKRGYYRNIRFRGQQRPYYRGAQRDNRDTKIQEQTSLVPQRK